MKKLLPILIALAVYLTPLYPIYAQTTGAATSTRTLKPSTASAKPRGLDNAILTLEEREQMIAKTEMGLENAESRLEANRERIASRAAALKEKLAKFKDQAKANRVEFINNALVTVNEKHTAHLTQILSKLSQILEKAKTVSKNAEADGQDVTALNEAISKVETKWNQASDAVKDQVEKDYSIVVNTESTVGADAKEARNNLRTDLKTVRDQVFSVKQSLSDVFPIIKSLRKADKDGS